LAGKHAPFVAQNGDAFLWQSISLPNLVELFLAHIRKKKTLRAGSQGRLAIFLAGGDVGVLCCVRQESCLAGKT
jgi:hypothetical protein